MLDALRARIHSRAALSATALIGATTATLLSVSGLAAQPVPSGTSPVDNPEETAFLAETTTSMATMMAGMAVTPSGDTDADFVAQMIAHHQGAIEMAQTELRYGHDEQLRRMAQEIIVTQQEEIATMRLVHGQALPSRVDVPQHHHTEP
jgi:uncharacterized protein (DUF305 family)